MRVLLLSSIFLAIVWDADSSPAAKMDITLLDELVGNQEQKTNIAEENLGSTDTFEGDMILSRAQNETIQDLIAQQHGKEKGETIQKRKHALVANLWPRGIVYYDPLRDGAFGKDGRKQSLINQAMNHIKERTCIKFREASSGDRVRFVIGKGCSSAVGKRIEYGVHKINLHPDCFDSFGTIVHEIMHALGFMHEQSRPDRDNYVTINTAAIEKGKESNFRKYASEKSRLYSLRYDVKSIMHYGPRAFSKDKKTRTIIANDLNLEKYMGQREKMSDTDAKAINLAYKCNGVGSSSSSGIIDGKPCIDKYSHCAFSSGGCFLQITKDQCPVTCKVCKPSYYY